MECKDRLKKSVTHWLQSINRNIVECKDGGGVCAKSYLNVLIETLWNVKNLLQLLPAIHQVRINRNIVECKAVLQVC